jgi:predicted RNase H-like nuclease
MLTQEAMDERHWGGLSHLRRVLEGVRRDHSAGLYPTSLTETEFDRAGKIAYLAALAADHRQTLVEAVEAERDRNDREARREALLDDLEKLEAMLHWVEQGARQRRIEIESLMSTLRECAR